MESAFGCDFSQVRIHRDAEAGEISRSLNALAFTHKRDIYFADRQFAPDHPAGARLLAHELTHVVQQGQASSVRTGPVDDVRRVAEPMIQRTATFTAGTAREVNNLANTMINGAAVGFTPPMLNGSIVLSTAATRAAIAKPTLAFRTSAAGGVDAQVAAVPTNTGSFDESVLAAGPWTLTPTKAAVGARFSTLTQCAGAGNSSFRAHGRPSDAAMFAANRRHEDHHAADHLASFNATVVPWDTKLSTANSAGTQFNGATEAAAEAALFAAMGGTTNQVADAYFNACVAANDAFHATAAGGRVTVESPTANADCSTSSATSFNPS
jgi:hypothetical protein